MYATFNLVSDCCHREIETRRGVEYPLMDGYGQSYKYEACSKCGDSCRPVESCGICGEVGCMNECE